MPKKQNLFGPSERALEFGQQYGEVLARWGELFNAAAALVQANVQLGNLANEAAQEFEQWLEQTANSPWNWLTPDAMQRFMRAFTPPARE